MTLKLRATHLAPPAYAHLKEYAVLSGNWQIGSISEERAGKGWFWALGVGTPFDPDKVKMHGSHVDSLDEAKRQISSGLGRVAGMGGPCRAATRRVKHSPINGFLQQLAAFLQMSSRTLG
jgi:hypothetical protein